MLHKAVLLIVLFVVKTNKCQSSEELTNSVNEFVKVDGEDYEEEKRDNITILEMSTTSGNIGNIDLIINFPNLRILYIENYNLTKLPVFANLPKLVTISLMWNELEIITNGSFAILELEELFLARNKIEEIYVNSFGSIKELFLTCNQLERVSNTWFTRPEILTRLHLAGNQIRTIEKNTFQGFYNLTYLDLRLNQLAILEDNSLAGLTGLKYFKLGDNKLENFPGTVFGSSNNTIHLTLLEMRYNSLSFLPDSFFSKLRIDSIIIWANPWQCACKKKIKDWWLENNDYNTNNFTLDYDTPCITPLSFQNICVSYNDKYVYDEFNKIFRPIPLKLCGKKGDVAD